MIVPTSYAAALDQRRLALCVRSLEDVQLCVLVVFHPEVKELDVAVEDMEGGKVKVSAWYEEVSGKDRADGVRTSWKLAENVPAVQTRYFARRCQMRLPIYFPSAQPHHSMAFRLVEPEPAILDDFVPALYEALPIHYVYSPLLPRVPILLKADASEFPRLNFSPNHLYELWISYEFERFEAQWMLPLTRAENPPTDGWGKWSRIEPFERIRRFYNQLGQWLPKTGVVVQLSSDGESALLMCNSGDSKGNHMALSSAKNVHNQDALMCVGDYVKYLPVEVPSNFNRTLHLALYTKPRRTSSHRGLMVINGSAGGEFQLSFLLSEQHRLTNEPISICVWESGGVYLTLSDPKGKLAKPELCELVGQQLSVAVRPSISLASGIIRWTIAEVLTPIPTATTGGSTRTSVVGAPSLISSLRPPPSPDAVSTIGAPSSSFLAPATNARLPPSPDAPKCADTVECDAVVQGAFGASRVVLLLVHQAGQRGVLEVARRYTPDVQSFNYPAEAGHWYRIQYQRYLLQPIAGGDPRVDEIHIVKAVRRPKLGVTYHANVINGRVCFRRPFRATRRTFPEEKLDYEVQINEWKQVESMDSMEDESQLMDVFLRSVNTSEYQLPAWCYPTSIMSRWNVAEVCWKPVEEEEEVEVEALLTRPSSIARGFATPERNASRRSGSPTSSRTSTSPAKTCGEIEEAPALLYEEKGNELLFLLFGKGSDLQIMKGEYKPECVMTKKSGELTSLLEPGHWYQLWLERYCHACTRFKLHRYEELPEPFLRVENIEGKVSIYTTILCRGNERNNYGCEMGRVLVSSWEMEHEASKIKAGINGAWVTPVCDFKKNLTKFQLTRVDGLIEDCTDQERKIVVRKKKPRKSPPRPQPSSPTQRINKNKDKLNGKAVVQCFGDQGVTLLILYGANQEGVKIGKRYTDDIKKFSQPLIVGQWYQIIYQRLLRTDTDPPAATTTTNKDGSMEVQPQLQPVFSYHVKIFGALRLGPEAELPLESKVIADRVCFLLLLKIVYQSSSSKAVQFEVFVNEWKYVVRFDNWHEGSRLRSLLESSREPCLRVDSWAYPMDNMREWGVAAVVWDKRRQENSQRQMGVSQNNNAQTANGAAGAGFNEPRVKSKDLGGMKMQLRNLREAQLSSETYSGPAALLARDGCAELVELWLKHGERWQLAYSKDIRRFNGEGYNRLGAWFGLQYRCVPVGSALFISILEAELKPEADHPFRAELMNGSVNLFFKFLLNGRASFHPPQPSKTECFMDEWLPVTSITRQHDQSQLPYRLKKAGGDVTLEFKAWCQPPTHPQGRGLQMNMITEWNSDREENRSIIEIESSERESEQGEQKISSPMRPGDGDKEQVAGADTRTIDANQLETLNINGSHSAARSVSSLDSQMGRSESISSSLARLNFIHDSTSAVDTGNAEPDSDAREMLNRTDYYHKAIVKRLGEGEVELVLLRLGQRRSVLGTRISTDMGLFTRCKPNDWYWLTYRRCADPMIDEKCIKVLKATNLTNMSPVKRNGKIDFVTRLKNGEVNFLLELKATALHLFPNSRRAGVVKFECLFGSEWESVAAFDEEEDRRTAEELLAEEGANWAQVRAWIRHAGFEKNNKAVSIYVVTGVDWNKVKTSKGEGSFMQKRMAMQSSTNGGLSPPKPPMSTPRHSQPPSLGTPSPKRTSSKLSAAPTPISSPDGYNPPQQHTPVRRINLVANSNLHLEIHYQHTGVVCHKFQGGAEAYLLYSSDFPTELRICGEKAKGMSLGQWLRFNVAETAQGPVLSDFEIVGGPPFETTPFFGSIFVKCQITVQPNVEESTGLEALAGDGETGRLGNIISAFGAPVCDNYEHLAARLENGQTSSYFVTLGYQYDPKGAAPAEGYWVIENIY